MNKVHRPDLVGMGGISSVLTELGFDPSLGCFVPQLQPQLIVKPTCPLHVDWPSFPQQEDMHAPIAVADPDLADLLDPELEIGLLAAFWLIGVEGAVNPQGIAGFAN